MTKQDSTIILGDIIRKSDHIRQQAERIKAGRGLSELEITEWEKHEEMLHQVILWLEGLGWEGEQK
jgi:hypothetical protein